MKIILKSLLTSTLLAAPTMFGSDFQNLDEGGLNSVCDSAKAQQPGDAPRLMVV